MDVTATTIGIMIAVSTYLILSLRLSQVIFGFVLFSNAINLLLLSVSENPDQMHTPILEDSIALKQYVDPIPQALILTAIVIGFALIALLILISYRLMLEE